MSWRRRFAIGAGRQKKARAPAQIAIAGKCLSLSLVFILLLVTGTTDSEVSNESRANLALFRGDRAFAAQDYRKAEVEYRDVLRIFSDDPVATRQLGISTRSREGWPKPMNICNAPGCSSRKNNTVLLKLGATFSAVGSYGEARDAATQILARQPDDEQALLLLTDAVRAPGEVEETRQRIEALRQRTETAPDTI